MKEKIRFSKRNMTIIACAFFIMTAFIANGILQLQKNHENHRAVVAEQQVERKYVLKIHNGKIAIFNKGDTEPFEITDISDQTLRNFDKDELRRGITVVGETELARRLEDYGS